MDVPVYVSTCVWGGVFCVCRWTWECRCCPRVSVSCESVPVGESVHVSVCMCVSAHVCIHLCVHVQACMWVPRVPPHVYMCVNVPVCIYTWGLSPTVAREAVQKHQHHHLPLWSLTGILVTQRPCPSRCPPRSSEWRCHLRAVQPRNWHYAVW